MFWWCRCPILSVGCVCAASVMLAMCICCFCVQRSRGKRRDDSQRDISELVALGLPVDAKKQRTDSMFDARLFNQGGGTDSVCLLDPARPLYCVLLRVFVFIAALCCCGSVLMHRTFFWLFSSLVFLPGHRFEPSFLFLFPIAAACAIWCRVGEYLYLHGSTIVMFCRQLFHMLLLLVVAPLREPAAQADSVFMSFVLPSTSVYHMFRLPCWCIITVFILNSCFGPEDLGQLFTIVMRMFGLWLRDTKGEKTIRTTCMIVPYLPSVEVQEFISLAATGLQAPLGK